MIVKVYRNLRQRCWSIKDGKKPIYHLGGLRLKDCIFRVQPAGRARVLRENRKNVHAYVKGEICSFKHDYLAIHSSCTYDPFLYSTFVDLITKKPLFVAKEVVFLPHGEVLYNE